jgi:hypothetical protein
VSDGIVIWYLGSSMPSVLLWFIKQTEELEEWLIGLDEKAQEDIRVNVRILQEFGPQLGRPQVDTVKNSQHTNMKELRVQSKGRPFRIFFAFDPSRNALLLIGGNKEGNKRFYKEMIPIADKLFDEYLEESNEKK